MTPEAFHVTRQQLTQDEGLRLAAYQDSLGYWTIGVGRMIDGRKGGGITEMEAQYLLDNDIRQAIADLKGAFSWFDSLDSVRQTVLVNMRFQLGLAGLRGFKNTLAAVARGDYRAAARGMRQSKWASQTPNRAQRLAAMMETGAWPEVI